MLATGASDGGGKRWVIPRVRTSTTVVDTAMAEVASIAQIRAPAEVIDDSP
jgi:hypothetical protein